jgi:Helix-turn-helix domain
MYGSRIWSSLSIILLRSSRDTASSPNWRAIRRCSRRSWLLSQVCAAMLIKTGGLKPRNLPRSILRLSVEEREEISRGLTSGTSCQVIAFRLNRSTSTVSRDVAANGGRQRYRAWRADERALRKAHLPINSRYWGCYTPGHGQSPEEISSAETIPNTRKWERSLERTQ